MTALAANHARQQKVHNRQLNEVAAKAGSVHFQGALLNREAITALGVPASDTVSQVVLGVVVETVFPDDPDKAIDHHLDNAAGADGVLTATQAQRVVRYDQVGEYSFAVSAGTPLPGNKAFVVDDNTVSANATTNNLIAGWFTKPAPDGGWLVDISKRNLATTP